MSDLQLECADLAEAYAFENYYQARSSFLQKAKASQARQESFAHPASPLASGVEFGVDTAWYGPADAEKVLIMISGTHGPELFSGSAMQRLWMDKYQAQPEYSDIGVLLIHAINAYGCAHGSRTTQNNVDLNRNFMAFPVGGEVSQLTEKVQNTLGLANRKGPRLSAIQARLIWLSARYGRKNIVNEVTAGQYQCQDGIGFGGTAPEWSHNLLKDILERYIGQAKQTAIIDWHTGIGAYGAPFFLCFDAPGTPEYTRALTWWGAQVSASAQGYSGKAQPEYQGLLLSAVQDTVQSLGAKTTAAVVEFGTYSNRIMLEALLRDRWLRSRIGGEADARYRHDNLEAVKQAFCPDDAAWRQSVIRHGQAILAQTLDGLLQWETGHA